MGMGATSLLVAAYVYTMHEFHNLTEEENGLIKKRRMKVRKKINHNEQNEQEA
jgi:hypothetical protein